MTAKFAVRSMLWAVILLIASSSVGQAQQIINLTPAPTPAGPHSFQQGADIVVAFGTNPEAIGANIQLDWMQPGMNFVGPYQLGSGKFSTKYPAPPGNSLIQAPAYDASNPNKVYSMTVRAYSRTSGLPSDTKIIQFKVTQ